MGGAAEIGLAILLLGGAWGVANLLAFALFLTFRVDWMAVSENRRLLRENSPALKRRGIAIDRRTGEWVETRSLSGDQLRRVFR